MDAKWILFGSVIGAVFGWAFGMWLATKPPQPVQHVEAQPPPAENAPTIGRSAARLVLDAHSTVVGYRALANYTVARNVTFLGPAGIDAPADIEAAPKP